ncbi:MAG: hypothetical protein MUD09_02695 [Desulfobacterales bacterium]|nr:hypothetical protein [Desulfobacterales bacterium]
MFGMDLFFKSAATGIKIAQLGVENMFKMMNLFAGLFCQTNKPATKEAQVVKKTTAPPQPEQVAKKQVQVSAETVEVSDIKTELSLKGMRPSAPAPASSAKIIPTKSDIKPEKKPVSPEKGSSSIKKPSTAIDQVQAFMERQKQGASTEEVMKATGFTKKKVQDILYKLKKRGILKSEKGIYILA